MAHREARVLAVEAWGNDIYLLHFERLGLAFRAGQYLALSLPGRAEQREYSIYSGQDDPQLSVLIKAVPHGKLSARLCRLQPGEVLQVAGPYGFFVLPDSADPTPLAWVATGTGISPFHSFLRTYPERPFRLLHGVRWDSERVLQRDFPPDRVETCLSGEVSPGTWPGRLTTRLSHWMTDPRTLVYLCGNCQMIFEAFDLLLERGLTTQQIQTEVYF